MRIGRPVNPCAPGSTGNPWDAVGAVGARYCTIQLPDVCDVEPVRLFAERGNDALGDV